MAQDTHRFDPTAIREYDIRGVVGRTLSAKDAYAVGRGFGTMVKEAGGSRAAVGYDGRLSSPALEAAVVEGLRDCGLDVIRVGRGPTPMLYFAVHALGTRRRGHDHRLPQPGRLQRLQDDARKASFYGASIQPDRRDRQPGRLCRRPSGKVERAAVARGRLRRRGSPRTYREAGMLTVVCRRRQRRGRTARHGAAGEKLAGSPRSCSTRRSTAASPTTIPIPRCRRTSTMLQATGARGAGRSGHRLRRRRAIASAWSTSRGDDHLGRPADDPLAARDAEGAAGRDRSSAR